MGIKHGEFIGEIIIGILVISGSGSAIAGAVKTCKTVSFVAKTYKRVNFSRQQILEDSINAIKDAF